jgi:hypothetical protein
MKLSGIANQENVTPYQAAIVFRRVAEAGGKLDVTPERRGEITPETAVRMSGICTSEQDGKIVMFAPPAYWLAKQAAFDEAQR